MFYFFLPAAVNRRSVKKRHPAGRDRKPIEGKEIMTMFSWLSRPFFFYLLLLFMIAYYMYDMAFGAVSEIAEHIGVSVCRSIGP